ncbi:MAG: nitrile hydratase accessory protein [Deltaproteobacteria bacterium]|nr:nitrile hydratase accessory protein [Deltaproteobacteria bacterium]MBW2416520.1 nitrile hydratase accessory protein [Deltaproteobacteria bacterium]
MSEGGAAKGAEQVLPQDGPGAPPRSNGELVFAEPWESRIFGITLALHGQDRFEWPEFQARLIEAIARHEAEIGEGEYQYYACWLEAFRSLATDKGWLDAKALAQLESELADRPAGHDH